MDGLNQHSTTIENRVESRLFIDSSNGATLILETILNLISER